MKCYFCKKNRRSFMKKTILATLILLMIQFPLNHLYGQTKINWLTFEEALKQNEIKPKKIFIDVYTDWCGWCKELDKNTFSNPQIAEYLNKYYYPVKFNAETKQEISYKGKVYRNNGTGSRPPHDLAIALLNGKLSYPSAAYLDDQSNLLTVVPGYLTPADIEPILVFFAENQYKSTTWEDFRKKFISKLK